jgi:hypothetical protein
MADYLGNVIVNSTCLALRALFTRGLSLLISHSFIIRKAKGLIYGAVLLAVGMAPSSRTRIRDPGAGERVTRCCVWVEESMKAHSRVGMRFPGSALPWRRARTLQLSSACAKVAASSLRFTKLFNDALSAVS